MSDNETTNPLQQIASKAQPNVPAKCDNNTQTKENFDEDYEYTRRKLKNLVDMGEEAIEHFKEVAEETSEPRAFEVLATLLKNTGELVKGIIDNASTKSDIDAKAIEVANKKDRPTDGSTVNNTTIFVGSTKELLEKINKEQNKIIDVLPTTSEK